MSENGIDSCGKSSLGETLQERSNEEAQHCPRKAKPL